MSVDPLQKKRVRIVGAGFSGLTCAYFFVKAGYEVEIYEKGPRSGGLVQTFKTPYGLVESAANALLSSERLNDLAKDIGLDLLPASKLSKARFIFRDRPSRFPVRGLELFSFLKFLFKMVFNRESIVPRAGESIREWGTRTLSPTLSFFTLETALQGIYAGDPEKMSASLILGKLFNREKKSKQSSVSPLGGMGELITKLEDYLKQKGVQFFFGESLNLKELTSPLVLATPAYESAKILEFLDPRLSLELSKIEYLPMISTNVFFDKNASCLEGFGCLFPPDKSNTVLGVLFNHCIFEGRVKNSISETWMMGGAFVKNRREFLAQSDHEILTMVLDRRRLLLPSLRKKTTQDLMTEVLHTKITRWEKAFPFYSVQLESILSGLESVNKNIILHGNYLGELGLSKILDRSNRIVEQLKLGES